MGFAWNEGNALAIEHQSDARQRRRCLREKAVVETAAATEAKSSLVDGKAGHESAIELGKGDAWAMKGIGFAQAERSRHDYIVPTDDFMPVELGMAILRNH